MTRVFSFFLYNVKVTIFNKSLQGAISDQDPTALDFSVNVKLGKLRFVFLGYFVAHLQVSKMFLPQVRFTYMNPLWNLCG